MIARKSFWYVWGGGTLVWAVLIFVFVPDVRRGDFSWEQLVSSRPTLLSHTSCGNLMDALAARTCAAIERGSRERRDVLQERRFRVVLSAASIFAGPPLLVLLAVYVSDAALPEKPRPRGQSGRGGSTLRSQGRKS